MVKIVNYDIFFEQPRWMFLKLETDDGLIGWVEPIVEGRAKTVAQAVKELMEKYVLKYENIDNIEDIWQLLYRGGFYRGGPVLMSALSGIDQALWDIKGKRYGLPVYQLLGGKCRKKVKVYRWFGGDEADESPEKIRDLLELGFKGIKMNVAGKMNSLLTPNEINSIVKRIGEVREVVGDVVDIAVDFHGRVSPALSSQLIKSLEKFNLLFIEEPVLPGNIESLRFIKNKTFTPIALGERLFSRWDFKPYLIEGLVDIVQPDLSHAGGITECKKIAEVADSFGALTAFHCPLGPISLAASIQVAATTYNYLIQETSLGIHYNKGVDLTDYLLNPQIFEIKDGYIEVPENPGLGVEINEETLKMYSLKEEDWSNPIWRREDYSLAEW